LFAYSPSRARPDAERNKDKNASSFGPVLDTMLPTPEFIVSEATRAVRLFEDVPSSVRYPSYIVAQTTAMCQAFYLRAREPTNAIPPPLTWGEVTTWCTSIEQHRHGSVLLRLSDESSNPFEILDQASRLLQENIATSAPRSAIAWTKNYLDPILLLMTCIVDLDKDYATRAIAGFLAARARLTYGVEDESDWDFALIRRTARALADRDLMTGLSSATLGCHWSLWHAAAYVGRVEGLVADVERGFITHDASEIVAATLLDHSFDKLATVCLGEGRHDQVLLIIGAIGSSLCLVFETTKFARQAVVLAMCTAARYWWGVVGPAAQQRLFASDPGENDDSDVEDDGAIFACVTGDSTDDEEARRHVPVDHPKRSDDSTLVQLLLRRPHDYKDPRTDQIQRIAVAPLSAKITNKLLTIVCAAIRLVTAVVNQIRPRSESETEVDHLLVAATMTEHVMGATADLCERIRSDRQQSLATRRDFLLAEVGALVVATTTSLVRCFECHSVDIDVTFDAPFDTQESSEGPAWQLLASQCLRASVMRTTYSVQIPETLLASAQTEWTRRFRGDSELLPTRVATSLALSASVWAAICCRPPFVWMDATPGEFVGDERILGWDWTIRNCESCIRTAVDCAGACSAVWTVTTHRRFAAALLGELACLDDATRQWMFSGGQMGETSGLISSSLATLWTPNASAGIPGAYAIVASSTSGTGAIQGALKWLLAVGGWYRVATSIGLDQATIADLSKATKPPPIEHVERRSEGGSGFMDVVRSIFGLFGPTSRASEPRDELAKRRRALRRLQRSVDVLYIRTTRDEPTNSLMLGAYDIALREFAKAIYSNGRDLTQCLPSIGCVDGPSIIAFATLGMCLANERAEALPERDVGRLGIMIHDSWQFYNGHVGFAAATRTVVHAVLRGQFSFGHDPALTISRSLGYLIPHDSDPHSPNAVPFVSPNEALAFVWRVVDSPKDSTPNAVESLALIETLKHITRFDVVDRVYQYMRNAYYDDACVYRGDPTAVTERLVVTSCLLIAVAARLGSLTKHVIQDSHENGHLLEAISVLTWAVHVTNSVVDSGDDDSSLLCVAFALCCAVIGGACELTYLFLYENAIDVSTQTFGSIVARVCPDTIESQTSSIFVRPIMFALDLIQAVRACVVELIVLGHSRLVGQKLSRATVMECQQNVLRMWSSLRRPVVPFLTTPTLHAKLCIFCRDDTETRTRMRELAMAAASGLVYLSSSTSQPSLVDDYTSVT
jgi:hypothetical protein